MAFQNNGDKAEAIKKFVDYFYSQDVYVGWVEAEGFLPVTKSGAEALASKPELKTFLDGLPTAKFYPAANPSGRPPRARCSRWSARSGRAPTRRRCCSRSRRRPRPAEPAAQARAAEEPTPPCPRHAAGARRCAAAARGWPGCWC